MPAQERATREKDFGSTRVVVGYQRYFQAIDADGRLLGQPVALSSVQPMSSSNNGLYVSVAASYEYISGQPSPYRWNLSGFWQWSTGGNYGQTTADHVALSWGGGLGLLSRYAYGYYYGGSSIPMTPGHVSSNSGFEYYFPEWQGVALANWGYILGTVGETRTQNYQSGVVFEYVHTFSTTQVSVTFGLPAPSISLSTGTDNWPLTDYVPVIF
ncbi:MAG: hypothetical protein HY262_00565 [Chloroflexi bacterium]|nr:hypothetical protein [Chloroflexota bacterium]